MRNAVRVGRMFGFNGNRTRSCLVAFTTTVMGNSGAISGNMANTRALSMIRGCVSGGARRTAATICGCNGVSSRGGSNTFIGCAVSTTSFPAMFGYVCGSACA